MVRARWFRLTLTAVLALVACAVSLHAQSPLDSVALKLEAAATGTMARSLVVLSAVVSGFIWMFGGGSRHIPAMVMGASLVLLAVQIVTWLFGV